MWSSSTIPNPLGWPLYDKYRTSKIDLHPKEAPSQENNYGNLDLPEVPYEEIKLLWDYMKEKLDLIMNYFIQERCQIQIYR